MASWNEDQQNQRLLDELRANLAGADAWVLVFLGAGLSFGAARLGGRASFEGGSYYRYRYPDWEPWSPEDPWWPRHLWPDADGLPLPSWLGLMAAMWARLTENDHNELEALTRFFIEESPLDCSELFRHTVGESNYREFLQAQFDGHRHEFVQPTPSHQALVELDLSLIFTTNYDELIEDAYQAAGIALRVSVDEDEFKAHRAQHPPRHLVKLHGSIDRPATIVLTRSDYSKARAQRREMLSHLRHELGQACFLFVGFSLSDPNFNLLHDDVRESLGVDAPISYMVQGRHDPVKARYLSSLGVNTTWLDTWNDLPNFLRLLRSDAGG